METIRSLIRGDLPPAGNTIVTSVQSGEIEELIFPTYNAYWVGSGTSALALALLAAKQKQTHIQNPEVIIPGYCCPDLVAAAKYAGVKPVIIDISVDDPSLDLVELEASISDQTIAVIAVAFLGIRENLDIIIKLLQHHPQTILIEDNAQWFPDPEDLTNLYGDAVIFSFGRGKPLSLLGGGLLLIKDGFDFINPILSHAKTSAPALKLKYLIYNLLLQPQLYQLLNRNPLIKLGETRYHALETIYHLDETRRTLFHPNLSKYWNQDRNAEKFFDDIFLSANKLNNLKALFGSRRKRLLRYPLLLPNAKQRDELIACLNRAGLGASTMYQKPLIEIEGINTLIKSNSAHTNSRAFAQRFITLPVHAKITQKHLLEISRHLCAL